MSTDFLSPDQKVDLTNCDREPIHIPGAILPHGAMLVLDPEQLVIEQVAGSLTSLLGCDAEQLLGADAGILFDEMQLERLRSLVETSDLSKPRHLLDPALRVKGGSPLDASVHRSAGRLVIEFEQADPANGAARDPLSCVQEMLEGLDRCEHLQDFCQLAAERVKAVLGYDRVMVYRFDHDDSGWVFAEAVEPALDPFLDLHYPASDIPKQARALYLRNWLRLICQVDYQPAPIVPQLNPATGAPLDMSQAILRDVSPIHRQYLRNMGVDASMSISIIQGGKLWGLISCHHMTPRFLPRHLRAIGELFGSMFSLQLEAKERAERFEQRTRSRVVLQQLMRNLATEDDFGEGLIRNSPNLLDYVRAGGFAMRMASHKGGVAIHVNSGVAVLGDTPDEEQIARLTDWLCNHVDADNGIFCTDRLSEIYPPAAGFAGVASGLLAISVSKEPRDFVMWFRPEVVQTVEWAGNPDKPVEQTPDGEKLTPRTSFAAWSQTVRGRSEPWTDYDRDAAFDLRVALLEVVLRRIHAAAQEREKAFARQQLLMAELDHRVKNTLANIQALVTHASSNADTLESFATGLNQRIQSMSRVHSLLTRHRWEGVSLSGLISLELEQYAQENGDRIDLAGPPLTLSSKASLAVSLAVHELSTNAAKYGSLSVPDGKVAVSWSVQPGGGVVIEWKESGGPTVLTPNRRGFGSSLIGRALELETGGSSELRFEQGGVECSITLPASALVQSVAEETAPAVPEAREVVRSEQVKRILLVEDSSLVIMMMEDTIEGLGWELVGPATRVTEALDLAAHEQVDAALLDINLDGEMSWEVGRLLRDRNIPFALTTGYDSNMVLPPDFEGTPVIGKPFAAPTIARWLCEQVEAE
ncbi:HWE histidine kinase domain-containing protein [Sphingomonas ginkgonis]|uniref:HWE histidine kinase domain-containing protein n=1 Tax=Sphingomonas ginkgonis TaxID=2315330 RepID=UPI001EF13734|nr:HWE histidine kinase domain-containing protein [Sphingomonas ginkgonis]